MTAAFVQDQWYVVEQDSFVWVFIGDPGPAASTRISSVPWPDLPGWTVVSGMEPLAAWAGLLVDNLLDLSHETYLRGRHHQSHITPWVPTDPTRCECSRYVMSRLVARKDATSTARCLNVYFNTPCAY